MLRNSSQDWSQEAAGSSVLGALVVPTTMGPLPSEESDERTPHPAISDDMDAMAAACRRPRFRLNTRSLLDLPYQGSADHTAVQRGLNPVGTEALISFFMTTLSFRCAPLVRRQERRFRQGNGALVHPIVTAGAACVRRRRR